MFAGLHNQSPLLTMVTWANSKAREWRHDSDKTQTNKPKWRTISLEHFLKQPVFLKHISETKTSPSLVGDIITCILFLVIVRFAIK